MNPRPQHYHCRGGRMSGDTGPNPRDPPRPSNLLSLKKASGGRPAESSQSVGEWLGRILYLAEWHQLLVGLFLATITISIGFADTTTGRILLPIEVLGANTAVTRTVVLQAGRAESVRSLWLQIHGLRYADQASVQINTSAWIPLKNNTVAIAEPGRSYGGIGGGFSTLEM